MHDQLSTGRKIRVLTMIDTFSRYVPVLDPRFSYTLAGRRCRASPRGGVKTWSPHSVGYVARSAIRRPFVSTKVQSSYPEIWICGPTPMASHWTSPTPIARQAIAKRMPRGGKLTDNAFIESFNGRFRAECLNAHWFLSLADAQEKLETCEGITTSIAHMVQLVTRSQWTS